MPRYENPPIPEEINVSKTSAFGEFVKLSIILIVFCVALVVIIFVGMRYLVPHIPFHYEVSLAENWSKKLDGDAPSPSREYLQKLAENLAAHMALPADMPITVHISASSTPNAFATFGGHIIVTQGLLDLVDSENALAMVLSHEIGHIKHRDPIVAAGSGVAVSIVLAILFGNSDIAAISNTSGLLTQLNFSRAQESAADQEALKALTQYYGHTNGAETFFKKMLETHKDDQAPPEFISTHPNTPERLACIETGSAHDSHAPLTPLPDFVKHPPASSKAPYPTSGRGIRTPLARLRERGGRRG
ncbi:MAG: M48 family metallopeptidase [Burkholderiales bacterium]|nr:M48 family metallopeptidase [Burkholderiales bacterium]